MGQYSKATDTVPEPCRVAGMWLKPFCLGHHLLFKRLGLPFTEAPLAESGVNETGIGILICSGESYEWTMSRLLDGSWQEFIQRMNRGVCGPWYARKRIDWREADSLFRAYLADGYRWPPVNRRDESKNAVRITAPWEVLLKCRLVQAGFSESAVLNGYLPARWYDFLTLKEMHQLETCSHPSRWRPVFFTEYEYRQMHPEERTP